MKDLNSESNKVIDLELVDSIIKYYKEYCIGVENGTIDEYEVSCLNFIVDKIQANMWIDANSFEALYSSKQKWFIDDVSR